MTSVAEFRTEGHQLFEIVADTTLERSPFGGTEFEDPSLSIYDAECRLIWFQRYPELGEVGFKIFDAPNGPLLYVSAVSVFHPVDLTIWSEELLLVTDDGVHSALSFASDDTYVGYLGKSHDFGVVLQDFGAVRVGNQLREPGIPGLIYLWKPISQPGNNINLGYSFSGPEQLDIAALSALRLPQAPTHPIFPLFKFVFGFSDPG